jgi:hypothetical protein
MEALQRSVFERLPFLSMDSEMVGTRELQKLSARSIEEMTASGPKIITIGGEMKAVLVDYKQFSLMQKRFTEMVKLTSLINQFMPKFTVPEGHTVSIDRLRVEITGTLQKIVSESPESSPFTDLLDAMLALSTGVFESSISAPSELKANAKRVIEKNAKKSGVVGVKPKKYITE